MRKQWISFWTNPSWHMAMRSLSWWSLLSLPKCYLPAPWESMGQEPFHQLTAPGASITVRTHDPETSPLTSYQKIKILAECRLHCEDYLRYVQSTFCLLWSQYRKLDFSSTWGVVLQAFPHVLARGGSPAAVWHRRRVTPLGVTHKRWKRHLLLWGSVKRFDTTIPLIPLTMIMAPYSSMSCKLILKFYAVTAVVLVQKKDESWFRGPLDGVRAALSTWVWCALCLLQRHPQNTSKPPRINAAKTDPDVQAGAYMAYMCMQLSLLVLCVCARMCAWHVLYSM
jgi:hypothetical protein